MTANALTPARLWTPSWVLVIRWAAERPHGRRVRTRLERDERLRTAKRGRFGAVKHVHPRPAMAELRGWFEGALAEHLPQARFLSWT